MRRFILTVFFVFKCGLSFCCINESRVLLSGQVVEKDRFGDVPYGHDFKSNSATYEDELRTLDSLWRINRNPDDFSDYGVRLVYLGRYLDAKNVFSEIERIQPGRYATAANMGTVYELLGENDSALYWIKKAVQIDPASHFSSEWLHVKILEAKINGKGYIDSKFLIGEEFGTDSIPSSDLSKVELQKLKDAMHFQLNERVSFIDPPDKIVGLLLFELGNITALADDITSALRIYNRAIEYGYQSEVLDKRYEKFRAMHEGISDEFKVKPRPKFKQPEPILESKTSTNEGPDARWLVAGGFLLLLGLIVYKIRKGLK